MSGRARRPRSDRGSDRLATGKGQMAKKSKKLLSVLCFRGLSIVRGKTKPSWPESAINIVREGKAQVAFLLNPTNWTKCAPSSIAPSSMLTGRSCLALDFRLEFRERRRANENCALDTFQSGGADDESRRSTDIQRGGL